jgi:hypothetical protein
MAIGLAAVVAGAVVGETESGVITGYSTAGLIAAVSTGVSLVLVGRLRLARDTVESSVAVDSPGDSLAFAASEASRGQRLRASFSARRIVGNRRRAGYEVETVAVSKEPSCTQKGRLTAQLQHI